MNGIAHLSGWVEACRIEAADADTAVEGRIGGAAAAADAAGAAAWAEHSVAAAGQES